MLVTDTDPLIPTEDETDTVVDAVRPGPEIFKFTALGENVKVCAFAVSGLHKRASAAIATNPVKLLCLRKRFLQRINSRSSTSVRREHVRCGSRLASEGPCYSFTDT